MQTVIYCIPKTIVKLLKCAVIYRPAAISVSNDLVKRILQQCKDKRRFGGPSQSK